MMERGVTGIGEATPIELSAEECDSRGIARELGCAPCRVTPFSEPVS